MRFSAADCDRYGAGRKVHLPSGTQPRGEDQTLQCFDEMPFDPGDPQDGGGGGGTSIRVHLPPWQRTTHENVVALLAASAPQESPSLEQGVPLSGQGVGPEVLVSAGPRGGGADSQAESTSASRDAAPWSRRRGVAGDLIRQDATTPP